MNYFKILEGLTKLVKSGQIKSVDEALAMLQRGGAKIDGILRQGVVNIFKKGKARDPDFGTNVTKMPVDDAGVPFNPNTLKSTTEKRSVESLGKDATSFAKSIQEFFDAPKAKRGVENLFKETKRVNIPAEKLNHQMIADQAGIDIELIKGKDWVEILEVLKGLKKADGGRIGFNNGGNLGLNEQAQNIYDSWISAGHSEADTLAYLESRGMYNTPVKQQGIMTAPNIINKKLRDDGGDDTGNIITPYDPNINLGPNKDVFDYEADAYGIGPTFRGQFARLKNAYSKIPTPFNIVKMGIQKAQDFADQRRKEKEREAAAATEALQAQITAQANITARDLVARGASPDFGKTETRSSSGWENSPFAKGGVATMFKRKR